MSWQPKLLKWYRKHRRDLPWRRTSDPYSIWVSEIMLQQTTVEAVIPYYERFLKKFPTVQSLASAPEEGVLKLWSGLGYYSRARNLHKAAHMVVKEWQGHVPSSLKDLQSLSGIGRYTAGAIASIAFEQRAPILDGNVIRVLSRLFAISNDPKSKEGNLIFWGKAEEILPEKSFGDFNQALMELGATVCVPDNPLCLLCPVVKECEAHATGTVSSHPFKKEKTVYHDVEMTAAVIHKGSRVLMVKREGLGILKGMWELPMVEGSLKTLLEKWPVRPVRHLKPVKHSVLNRRLKILPVVCEVTRKSPVNRETCWIRPDELSRLASSSMNRKILAQLIS